jgi:hypothetical protein
VIKTTMAEGMIKTMCNNDGNNSSKIYYKMLQG